MLVKASLECNVTLACTGEEYDFIKSVESELKTAFIVSGVKLVNDESAKELSVTIEKAEGEKCERCWSYSTTVGQDAEFPCVCARCAAVLRG